MNRIVIDTNVYISAVIFGGVPLDVVIWCQNHCDIFISIEIINEIKDILRCKFNFDEKESTDILEAIVSNTKIVFPKNKINLFETPGDNKILECAVEGRCNIIISGDKKHLLKIRNFQEIEIITPKEFYDRFM